MHPNWQKKIVKYYETIVSNNEKENSQIFIATHSPFIISQALSDKSNSIIILSRKSDDKIFRNEEKVLSYDSANEINYLAFNLESEAYFNELYGELCNLVEDINYKKDIQEKNKKGVNRADKFLKNEYGIEIDRKRKYIGEKGEPIKRDNTYITFIRNCIHHKENKKYKYLSKELSIGIKNLRLILIVEKLREMIKKEKNNSI